MVISMKRIRKTGSLLKSFWLMTATSFTCVVLFMALFQPLGWEGLMTALAALELFLMCVTISAAMLLWDIPEQGLERRGVPPKVMLVVDPLLRCLAVLAIVLLEGVWFGFFPLAWGTVLGLLPVVVPVFLVTYFITVVNYYRVQREAQEINETIRRKGSGPDKPQKGN